MGFNKLLVIIPEPIEPVNSELIVFITQVLFRWTGIRHNFTKR